MASDVNAKGESGFRQYLPDLSAPRFRQMRDQTAHEYVAAFHQKRQPPWLHALYLHWQDLYREPFKGVTNDGRVRPNLFQLQDEGVCIKSIVAAAEQIAIHLDNREAKNLSYHSDAPEWRTWSNPEFLFKNKGIRLDEIDSRVRAAVMNLLGKTLSPEGYEKCTAAMRVNGFLGELVSAPSIMNEFSYNFVFFGKPTETAPWGFSFYGHHLVLNVFFCKTQMVISPSFTGAEPNEIDDGENAGTTLLTEEARLGLRLMQSLTNDQRTKARIYELMTDPAMPKGRWNHDDQRHLLGAYRDNRVVPYEGIVVSTMAEEQQSLVRAILEAYLVYYPEPVRELKLQRCFGWSHETYFCWIGGFGDDDPFYYRIQSPVIAVEFDHHSGVFLTNKEPAKFHIHTLMRTPNGGDYGIALRKLIPGKEQAFVREGE